MRFTIERLRTLVLVTGLVLVVALVSFLGFNRWKSLRKLIELPKRLGVDIQQEANGFTYTQAHGGHTLFKIHASKVVQLKKGGHALLHDVQIELYGMDGSSVDRIQGQEFEYDPKEGTARATGPVEITIMRPGVAPAIAPKAMAGQASVDKGKGTALAGAAQTASHGEIHVKTSALLFDQKSGVAATSERVEFAMTQGTGSALGATYDSQNGQLVLNSAVELNLRREGETVRIRAHHAEFERGDLACALHAATAAYRGGDAEVTDARVLFREDGSAVRLDATNGLTIVTASESRLAAPVGALEFDDHNHPRHGHLQGGVTLASTTRGRQVHGTAPSAELAFTPLGELQQAHLERGVELHTVDETQSKGESLRLTRDWRSPVAEIEFHDGGHGRIEPRTIHGTGGVTINADSQGGKGASSPTRLTADEVTGTFAPDSVLTGVVGVGHTRLEETTAAGSRQTSSGDRIEARFGPGQARSAKGSGGSVEVESAVQTGHVALLQEPAARPGAAAPQPMRATAGRAEYEATGEWLHLTLSPRVEDASLQLTADRIDFSQATGDAFAHGNVKASWSASNGDARPANGSSGSLTAGLGGQGPAHVVASEAQMHQATGEATFRGQARLWQQANSISAPLIVLDRQRQTLVARGSSQADPVRAVLLSTTGRRPEKESAGKSPTPSVIRLSGGDLKYSDAEHKAVLRSGSAGSVNAETSTASSVSGEVELVLLPPGNHAGKEAGQAQVDTMTARGHVVVSSQGRRGTGEQLVYSGENGEYVLTGTAAQPPRMTDPARGSVTGEALIFHSRDDSVSIEGGGRRTTTETSAPK